MSLRVLIVDDDEIDRISVRRTLLKSKDTPVEILEAHTCATGLALLQREAIDCALVDYRLPDGDARTLLTAARNRTAAIVLTGLDDQETALQTLQEGAQDYLVKGSLGPDLLLRSIKYAMERFRILEVLERVNHQLERQAFLDPLTDTLNRRGLEHILQVELARAERGGAVLFGVLVDCDDFKGVNERYGHATGDRVLVEIAARIRRSIRREDHLARIGGDEFLILLPSARAAEARQVAERVREDVASERLVDGAIEATVSLGVFQLPANARSVTDLLVHAQASLRASKLAGKNRVSAGPQARSALLETVTAQIESILSGRGDLHVMSEPIVDLATRETRANELWICGPSGPFEIAEELFSYDAPRELLVAVELRCLSACAKVHRAHDASPFHLNLHWCTLSEAPLQELQELLSDGNACIELNMRSLIGDPGRFIERVRALRQAGVRLVLEEVDFGQRSLEALLVLRPAFIKVNPQLVSSAIVDARQRSALERLVRAAAAIDCEVIALGVESSEVKRLVVELGVHLGQDSASVPHG